MKEPDFAKLTEQYLAILQEICADRDDMVIVEGIREVGLREHHILPIARHHDGVRS